MKVIKHGNTKSTAREIVTKCVTCPICGCEFEYDSDDVQSDIHNNAYVICPECNALCERTMAVFSRVTKRLTIGFVKPLIISLLTQMNR